jgi:hypothetical protein
LKATIFHIALCIACSLLVFSCSSDRSAPGRTWQPTALGDISADRCLYYAEAEDFKDKAGGDIDLKNGASKQKCLGMRWGQNPTDFASYPFELDDASSSTLLVLRVAFEGDKPQSYDVLIDGTAIRTATVEPTGGFGYSEKEWKCYSVPLGQVTKGPHTLTIKPSRAWQVINIDCLALGKTG